MLRGHTARLITSPHRLDFKALTQNSVANEHEAFISDKKEYLTTTVDRPRRAGDAIAYVADAQLEQPA